MRNPVTTDKMEVGKFYLGVAPEDYGGGNLFFMTGKSGDFIVGTRVNTAGAFLEGVGPARKGAWVQITETEFREFALDNFTAKMDELIDKGK
jgi:hypothetical protein